MQARIGIADGCLGGLLFADGGRMCFVLRASAGQRLRPAQSCGLQYSHASANPRQKRFRIKGGRGDGA